MTLSHNSRLRASTKSPHADPTIFPAVYDGQQALGFVAPHGCGFMALTADGAPIDTFVTADEASEALMAFGCRP